MATTATVRDCLLIIQEPTYGTPVASPVIWPASGANAYFIPLIDGNSYSGVEDPVFTETPYGGGTDVPGEVIGDHFEVKGSLSTLLYPALGAFLGHLAITRSDGATLPFPNTEPAFDLASVTLIHGIKARDGTYVYAHSGMKVASFTIDSAVADPRAKIRVDFIGKKETPNAKDSSTGAEAAFVWPTEDQLPKGPYKFSETAGNITFNAGVLQRYDSLSIKVTNKPDPRFWEDHWIDTCGVYGRDTTADMDLLLKKTPDLRALYQQITQAGFSVEFNNGTNTFTLNFNNANYISKLPYDLPLGREFTQRFTARNMWSGSSTPPGDLVLTTT